MEENKFELKNPVTGEVILSGYVYKELLDGKIQVHIETQYEIYDGPIEYLSFWNERK